MQSEIINAARRRLLDFGIKLSTQPPIAAGKNLFPSTSISSPSTRAWLSIGLPSSQFASTTPQDIFWCPNGLPLGTSLFVASSRLGRDLSLHSEWFDAFRTLICRINPQHQFLVSAAKTTADRFLQRASDLFKIDILEFKNAPKNLNRNWFAQTNQPKHPNRYPCFRIPVMDSTMTCRDELLSLIADEVRVLRVRKGGKMERVLMKRCQHSKSPKLFLLHSACSSSAYQKELLNSGALPWVLFSGDPQLRTESSTKSNDNGPHSRVPFVKRLPPGKYLIHCTRPRFGPWPDQTEDEYLDDLIFQTCGKNHSANAALARILATGYLHASNQLTRTTHRVVCFTETPLEELAQLRKFQSHLSRWDFLPVGIAICQSALIKVGAKPVIYGDESTWANLPENERPLFQVATTSTRSGKRIDWRKEREWRVIGDLSLKQFAKDEIFAFNRLRSN